MVLRSNLLFGLLGENLKEVHQFSGVRCRIDLVDPSVPRGLERDKKLLLCYLLLLRHDHLSRVLHLVLNLLLVVDMLGMGVNLLLVARHLLELVVLLVHHWHLMLGYWALVLGNGLLLQLRQRLVLSWSCFLRLLGLRRGLRLSWLLLLLL